MDTIRVAKVRPNAVCPTRKHADDAGMDLYAAEDKVIPAHGIDVVHTGVTVEIPQGFVGLMKLKSRSNYLLGAGVVDAGYQGEILTKIANPTDTDLVVKTGDAIVQMLIIPVETPVICEVPLDEIHQQTSARGATGGILGTD